MFSIIKFFIVIILWVSKLKILLKNINFISLFIKIKYVIDINKIKVNKIVFFLKWKEKISFDAIDVIYIKIINIPPKKIKNNEYENQKLFVINPVIIVIKSVCVINIIPILNGWFIIKNKIDEINNI